jgi:hypothetical protein
MWGTEKFLSPAGNRTPAVHLAVRRCTVTLLDFTRSVISSNLDDILFYELLSKDRVFTRYTGKQNCCFIVYWNPQMYKCYPFIKSRGTRRKSIFLKCQEHHVFRLKHEKFNEVCHEMQDIMVKFSATNCLQLQ